MAGERRAGSRTGVGSASAVGSPLVQSGGKI